MLTWIFLFSTHLQVYVLFIKYRYKYSDIIRFMIKTASLSNILSLHFLPRQNEIQLI